MAKQDAHGMIHIHLAAIDRLIPSAVNTEKINPGRRRYETTLIKNANLNVWNAANGVSIIASKPVPLKSIRLSAPPIQCHCPVDSQ
jgi:hypothetical protein